LDELQEVGGDAGARGNQQLREDRHQGSRSLIGLSPLRRPGHDDRAFLCHADVVRYELHRLLHQPLTGFQGDEGTDLERQAIAALLELLHQLAYADVSAHRFPSVPLRRAHTYPLVE
jgi:hypothetical protein